MHAKPNKPIWNVGITLLRRFVRHLLAIEHMVFYYLTRIVVDCEQSLIFFWVTIDEEHGKSQTRSRNDGEAWAKIFPFHFPSLWPNISFLLFTVHVHKSLRVEGRPLTVWLRSSWSLLSIGFASRIKRLHIHVSGIFFFLPLENDTYVECAGTVEDICVKVAVTNLHEGKNVLEIFLSYINCYDKETKTCPFRIARNINDVIQTFKKHIYAHHGLLARMLKKIIPGRSWVHRKHPVKTYNQMPF